MTESKVKNKINSHNEWDKLKEVIVGTADGTTANITWMRPEPIPEEKLEKANAIAKKSSIKWFYDEVAEDTGLLLSTNQKCFRLHFGLVQAIMFTTRVI